MTLRLHPAGVALRLAVSLVAAGIAAGSLSTYINRYEGAPCFAGLDFLLLPALFSISMIWLFSEAIQLTSAAALKQPIGRVQALMLGLLVHFSIGIIGFVVYPNVAAQDGLQSGEAVWIPMWSQGVLYKVGHFSVCR